jgi:hypothetical protein
MKFKMLATAGLSLTLDPMGKMFQNASSLKHFSHRVQRTKNVKFVEDHSKNIHVQFGFIHICSFWEEGIWTFSHQKLQIWLKPNCTWMFIGWFSTNLCILFRYEIQNGGYGRSRQFEFHIGTKNLKIVEDHPMNILVHFGFNHICSFWEEGIWTFSHRVQC